MTFTLYIEWQCPKCHWINHTSPRFGSVTWRAGAFAGSVPERVTCVECETVWLASAIDAELARRGVKKLEERA